MNMNEIDHSYISHTESRKKKTDATHILNGSVDNCQVCTIEEVSHARESSRGWAEPESCCCNHERRQVAWNCNDSSWHRQCCCWSQTRSGSFQRNDYIRSRNLDELGVSESVPRYSHFNSKRKKNFRLWLGLPKSSWSWAEIENFFFFWEHLNSCSYDQLWAESENTWTIAHMICRLAETRRAKSSWWPNSRPIVWWLAYRIRPRVWPPV